MAKTTKKKRAQQSATPLRTGGANAQRAASFDFKPKLPALALIAAALWIYWPALSGRFLWDDVELVTGNMDLRSLAGLGKIWFSAPTTDYWPLTWTLLWAEWQLWGAQPLGYHLCSVALHVASGFLLWRLLHRIGLRWGWLGGLLFVVHPLAVESVAWISEIKNTFSLVFYLLACDAWLDAEEEKPSGYGRSLLFYVAALLAKTSTVALPLTLLLYCWWRRGTVTRRELLRLVPFFAIALALGMVTLHFQSNPVVDAAFAKQSLFTRTIQAGSAFYFYLGRFLFPFGFLPVYPLPSFASPSALELLAVPSLLAIFAGLWTQRRGWGRHVLFGLGFFLLNIAPVLGVLKMNFMTVSWVSDHLAYLAMLGLMGLIVAGWESLHPRLAPAWRQIASGAGLFLLALLAWESRQVASLFADSATLWSYTAAHNPGAYLAHGNLGSDLMSRGRPLDAMEELEQALRINPNYPEAHQNLGTLLLKAGHVPEAEAQYQLALKANPHYANAYNGLGVALMQTGFFAEAITQYDRALVIDPSFANVHHNKATALLQLGRVPEAIAEEKLALASYPDFAEARAGLARAQAALNGGTSSP